MMNGELLSLLMKYEDSFENLLFNSFKTDLNKPISKSIEIKDTNLLKSSHFNYIKKQIAIPQTPPFHLFKLQPSKYIG